ncbi:hypothetical protein LEMLEM_LOCUS15154 [Lemmus lemmus]
MHQNGGLRIGGPFRPIYSKSPPPRNDDKVGGSGAEVLPAASGYKGKGVGALCVDANTPPRQHLAAVGMEVCLTSLQGLQACSVPHPVGHLFTPQVCSGNRVFKTELGVASSEYPTAKTCLQLAELSERPLLRACQPQAFGSFVFLLGRGPHRSVSFSSPTSSVHLCACSSPPEPKQVLATVPHSDLQGADRLRAPRDPGGWSFRVPIRVTLRIAAPLILGI